MLADWRRGESILRDTLSKRSKHHISSASPIDAGHRVTPRYTSDTEEQGIRVEFTYLSTKTGGQRIRVSCPHFTKRTRPPVRRSCSTKPAKGGLGSHIRTRSYVFNDGQLHWLAVTPWNSTPRLHHQQGGGSRLLSLLPPELIGQRAELVTPAIVCAAQTWFRPFFLAL